MSIVRSLLALLVLIATLGAPSLAAAQSAGVLRVSAIPDESPTELQRKFKPLGDYLKRETGMDVQFVPVTDYAAVVEGLATNKLDLAWLGGFTYVQARLRTHGGAVPIVQRAEDAKFTSRFIVPVNSTAKTLADLKGKTFAFVDPSSTSGHLFPKAGLIKAGFNPDKDFARVIFSGSHDANAVAIQNKRVDAVAIADRILDAAIAKGLAKREDLVVVWKSDPIPESPTVWRKDLDPALKKKISDFMFSYGVGDTPEAARQRAVLARIQTLPFKHADDTHLLTVREMEATGQLIAAKHAGDYAEATKAQSALNVIAKERAALPKP